MAIIKQCPFCAESSGVEVDDVTTETYAVCCDNCGATGPQALSEDDAIECWNSRT